MLKPYDKAIKADDLKEYPSTFGYAFDMDVETKDGEDLQIRGFAYHGLLPKKKG